jgi:hypothetical protein
MVRSPEEITPQLEATKLGGADALAILRGSPPMPGGEAAFDETVSRLVIAVCAVQAHTRGHLRWSKR